MAYEGKKQGVWDTRLSPPEPCYAVRHGANQVSAQSFTALTANPTQHVYNVQVPSLQTFVDRCVRWQSTVQFQFCFGRGTAIPSGTTASTTTLGSYQQAVNQGYGPPIQGQDFALASYPLQRLTTSMLLSVNDTSTTLNTQQLFPALVRLLDSDKGRRWDTTPVRNGVYIQASDGAQTASDAYADCTSAQNFEDPANGAFPYSFVIPANGSIIGGWSISGSTSTGYTATNGSIVAVMATQGGIPFLLSYQNTGATTALPTYIALPYVVQYTFAESLLPAPFTSGETNATLETAMFGINNFQLSCQMQGPDSARILRQTANPSYGGIAYGATGTASSVSTSLPPLGITALTYYGNGFAESKLLLNFLTAPLTMHIPDKSIVPYTDLVVYPGLAQAQQIVAPGQTATITTNNVTLSSVPDYLVVYAQPAVSQPFIPSISFSTATSAGGGDYGSIVFGSGGTSTMASATTTVSPATATVPQLPVGTVAITLTGTGTTVSSTISSLSVGDYVTLQSAVSTSIVKGLVVGQAYQVVWNAALSGTGTLYIYAPGVTSTNASLTTGQFNMYKQSSAIWSSSGITDYTYDDWFLPITNVNATFDNASGLLSSVSPQQLWKMSRENGLNMPYLQYSNGTINYKNTWGAGIVADAQNTNTIFPGTAAGRPSWPVVRNQSMVNLSGGPTVLSMGKDIQLYETLAPGVAGNFSVSFQLQVFNPLSPGQCTQYGGSAAGIAVNVNIIAVNSGFFTSIGGQSSRTVTPLIQADVASSNGEHKSSGGSVLTTGEVKRMIGGGTGWHDMSSAGMTRIGHMLSQPRPMSVHEISGTVPQNMRHKRGRGTPQGYDGIEMRLS